jgi:hypothetical protein
VRAVTVGPGSLEYSANPGDVISGNLFLENEQSETQTYYSSFQAFTEQNGNKAFFTESIDLPTWIQTATSTTLRPGQQEQVPFTITVPKDAPPGGHFAVIWWGTAPPSSGGASQVAVVSRAGILVYLQVSGNIVESADVSNLSAGRTVFFASSPITTDLDFQNNGNSYLKPGGTMELQNIFGITQASAVVNQYGQNVLPRTEKSFSVILAPSQIVFGPYRVKANITYGTDNKAVTKTVWIWILPWPTLIAVVLFLLIVFIAIPKGIRHYNRWIVEKARAK